MILRLQQVLSAPLQREFGISHFEYLILAQLSQAPGSALRMSVLATRCGSSLPRLSQAVSRLQKRGWRRQLAGHRIILIHRSSCGADHVASRNRRSGIPLVAHRTSLKHFA